MSDTVPKSLHRLREGSKSDWDDIPDDKLTRLQRIAKKTKGILTAANLISIAGTVMVLNGLSDFAEGRKMQGILKIAGGRIGDVADGIVAESTGTKGRVGRALDPAVDVIQLGVALPILVQGDALPLIPAVAAAAPKAIDIAATAAATVRGRELNPTSEGKKSIAMIWAGIGAFMLKYTFDKHLPGAVDTALDVSGWTGMVGGAAYHLPATKEYAQIGFGPRPENTDMDYPNVT